MGLDIRLPIGMMFSLMGPILVATGYLEGTPLNVQAGSVMGLFGLTMIVLSLPSRKRGGPLAP
jgi:hypothetical protein